jgi:protein-L-isoaspartate(D-aspartate) O-methyltransferase
VAHRWRARPTNSAASAGTHRETVQDMALPRLPHHGYLRDGSRDAMVELLHDRGIRDRCVMAALIAVPRELFVPPHDVVRAYADAAIPLPTGGVMPSPSTLARMIEALAPGADDRVLEIGTGTGYTAAVLSQLVSHVDALERTPAAALAAKERLGALGYDGITVHCGDPSLGLPDAAPFDAILVSASAPDVPRPLVDQLAIGGRLVIAIGQELVVLTRQSGSHAITGVGPTSLPLLVGHRAWHSP